MCLKSLSFPSSFEIHQKTNYGEKCYEHKECENPSVCPSFFPHERTLSMEICHGKKDFDTKWTSPHFPVNHERIHRGKSLINVNNVINLSFFFLFTSIPWKNHTAEEYSGCKECGKAFHLGGLQVHERIHNGEKAFKCKLCVKSFISPC